MDAVCSPKYLLDLGYNVMKCGRYLPNTLKMEAAGSSKMLVNIYQSI
jgi:hypothetical protein